MLQQQQQQQQRTTAKYVFFILSVCSMFQEYVMVTGHDTRVTGEK